MDPQEAPIDTCVAFWRCMAALAAAFLAEGQLHGLVVHLLLLLLRLLLSGV
jgi:hypothetical protein